MKDLSKFLISPDTSLKEAIAVLDATGQHICLVVDSEGRLLGTVSDGDIRRAILADISLDQPAHRVMNREPRVAQPGSSRDEISQIMARHSVAQIPVVDGGGRVIRLETLTEWTKETLKERPNWVVVMAGGLGTRLRPLTADRPKPLLKIGDKPILESIIENCVSQNFRRFYLSVNYKAEMIREHFGDGSRWNVDIRYLEESEPLGTAGSLSLLPERLAEPLLVINGDLLTDVNLGNLLKYHQENEADATMGVREFDFQVPFGVVHTEHDRIANVDEKPVHKFFVNAGVYAINPSVMDHLEDGQFMDMTDLLNVNIAHKRKVVAFPIFERWIDVGQHDDYRRAQEEY